MTQSRYREVTVSSVVFGLVVGAVMNASITYAGLKIGFTIGGSAIAAVLGFGVLRGILRQGTILETNIGQTIASAVNVPNSGVIFTVPVLYLLGIKLSANEPNFWLIMLACVAGAVLGTAFIIPVRKQMIDIDRLRFPTGTAVAAILKSPGAGAKKSLVLVAGAAIAAVLYLPVALPGIEVAGKPLWGYSNLNWRLAAPAEPRPGDPADLSRYQSQMNRVDHDGDRQPDLVMTDETIDVGRLVGLPHYMQLVLAIAPFALGAGYITGRPGLLVLAGGVLAYFVLNPAAYLMGMMPAVTLPHEAPHYGYSALNRPLGIGMLLGGAIMGVIFALPALKAALKSITAATKGRAGSDELGIKLLAGAVVLCGIGLFLAADLTRSSVEARQGWLGGLNPHLQSLVIAAVGMLWIWFAGIIIAQCTGMTDWSPISGMALLTVVLMMALGGPDDVIGAVLIGAALCVAVTCAADMMQDLKTGHLVGAQPKRQQVVELLTAGLGPIIAMGTILLIAGANLAATGIPIGPGTETTAPQAQALQAVIVGVQGGEMPYALYGCGALLGMAMGLGTFSGLGVLVGLSMYLPISYILTYGIGCLLNMLVGRVKGKVWAEEWGVPFCAGLIVGEAVLALVINAAILLLPWFLSEVAP